MSGLKLQNFALESQAKQAQNPCVQDQHANLAQALRGLEVIDQH